LVLLDVSTNIKAITEIVNLLIQVHKEGKVIHLNRVKQDVCAKYQIATQPKTVDIINAIPEQYKKALLPALKAKPVRTASGVS
jgi:elongator complex protein 3